MFTEQTSIFAGGLNILLYGELFWTLITRGDLTGVSAEKCYRKYPIYNLQRHIFSATILIFSIKSPPAQKKTKTNKHTHYRRI